jgi:hypothetical protein
LEALVIKMIELSLQWLRMSSSVTGEKPFFGRLLGWMVLRPRDDAPLV